jgi:catechol 2,3-dioxygenase-like lactoylglutathione lyase family enzyme
VPLLSVEDVQRSVAFYRVLGFDVKDANWSHGVMTWVHLEAPNARIMLERARTVIASDAVVFHLRVDDLPRLAAELVLSGVAASPITNGSSRPVHQIWLLDPDGHRFIISAISDFRSPRRPASGRTRPA